jgi:glycosyltransferase involved in cell wall biosynthesis
MVKVSVVIPTFNRRKLLKKCLSRLVRQDMDPSEFEIIIADDENSLETKTLVLRMKAENPDHNFVYTRVEPAHGPASARNAGWRRAQGELIAFTDDDCLPNPDWLSQGAAVFAFDEHVDAVWGKVIVPLPEHPTDYQLNTAGLSKEEFVTANCFCRKFVLEEIDGFDERFYRPWREDSDLYFTLMEEGAHVRYVPSMVVYHPAQEAPFGVSIFMQKNNIFEPLLYKKHRELYKKYVHFPVMRSFYAIVSFLVLMILSLIFWNGGLTLLAFAGWATFTGSFIYQRLKRSSHDIRHIWEMIVTSVLIPPLAVYWRMVGAFRFRVLFI